MDSIIYREYKSEDIFAIRKILERDLGYSVPLSELEYRINEMLCRQNYRIFVACNENEAIGFVGFVSFIAFERKNEAVKVIALAVSEEYRHRGIGANLLKEVEDFCRENKFDIILINSGLPRTEAHKFYETRGYNKKSYGFTKLL